MSRQLSRQFSRPLHLDPDDAAPEERGARMDEAMRRFTIRQITAPDTEFNAAYDVLHEEFGARGEIEEIRGVTVSSTIMRTLQERNWIRVLGHREVPGHPELLGTTREFLDYFGLKGLDQLPSLAELKDVETIGVQLELPSGDLAPEAPAVSEEIAAQDEPADASATGDADASAPEQPASPMVAEGGDGLTEQPTLAARANDSRGDSW